MAYDYIGSEPTDRPRSPRGDARGDGDEQRAGRRPQMHRAQMRVVGRVREAVIAADAEGRQQRRREDNQRHTCVQHAGGESECG
jgi:hypothetical protein